MTTSTQQTGDRELPFPAFLAELCVHDSDIDLHETITCVTIFRLFPPACNAADLLGRNIPILFTWYGNPFDILIFFDGLFQLWFKKWLMSLLKLMSVDYNYLNIFN